MTPKEFDAHHLWHPYSSVSDPAPMHRVARADGVTLTLADGAQMIDGMASWWSAIHGYGQPSMVKAVQDQAAKMSHVMFGGLTHDPAIELGRRLLDITPAPLQRIFYVDSGSVAVEVAMKMAAQYQQAVGRAGKHQFVTPRGGYHGDTWKAMSVCDPVTGMHHIFKGALSIQHFAPRPPIAMGQDWTDDDAQNGLGALRAILAENHATIAGMVIEPVVQGAGGMYFYHPRYLDGARALCDEFDVVLIFDEIATGFGRTGKMFATDHCEITPDILCMGKAITGGMMSFAATMTTDKIANGIGSAEPGVFMHGPTFMGNPLACAAAAASLDLLGTTPWRARVGAIETQMRAELEPLRALDGVADVRVLGAIGVVEMDHFVSSAQAHPISKQLGVWLRPFGHNIYCMPPYVTSGDELSKITHAMGEMARVL
ncbi:hypothetical protein GCM10007939_20770 [Amylibacter marinus]|uniref:Adenosylmethionine-8-amino-7-oxononanoate aminotransferase n=1 Tax=Amylibacter marinus TaxID=1475483 RepID=A0ABQ5VXC5_9RHOB|nr:adenosylmethionine--8-amino-7-oxononanoate transaminase [Amylibacter marinus]GLQ35794.1 hypothetical protein GCM10007939_20770 [Amylibacter marinus]